jgi:hypothetical protein
MKQEAGTSSTVGHWGQRPGARARLAAATLSLLAWVWAVQLSRPSTTAGRLDLVINLLPLGCFLLSCFHLWRAIDLLKGPPESTAARRTPNATTSLPGWPARRHHQVPADRLRASLPTDWTLTAQGDMYGDPLLVIDTGTSRYGIRIHEQSEDVRGEDEVVFERHRRALLGLKKWNREHALREAIWWLPDAARTIRFDRYLQLFGGSAENLIDYLQAAGVKKSSSATRRPERPQLESRSAVPPLTDREISQALTMLRKVLPNGWRLFEDVPLHGDVTLPAVALSRQDDPLVIQILPADQSPDVAPSLTGRVDRVGQQSGFRVLGWSPSTSFEQVVPLGDHSLVFGTPELLSDLLRLHDAAHLEGVA